MTPSAVKSPATSVPQTVLKSTASPMAMSTMRPMSTKIDGRRSRQLPFSAFVNSARFTAFSTATITRNPKAVAATRVQVKSSESTAIVTWATRIDTAAVGTT